MLVKHRNAYVGDLIPSQPTCEESIDGDLVGRTQPGRCRASKPTGFVGQRKAAKRCHVGQFEVESGQLGPVNPSKRRDDPMWIAKCVPDRETHVGQAELCDRRTVGVLDHRVHDRLRMYDDLDRVIRHIEQFVGLDYLEAFVHQRAGVDRDLGTHRPRRMSECLLDGDVRQIVRGSATKRSTTCGQHDTGHLAAPINR